MNLVDFFKVAAKENQTSQKKVLSDHPGACLCLKTFPLLAVNVYINLIIALPIQYGILGKTSWIVHAPSWIRGTILVFSALGYTPSIEELKKDLYKSFPICPDYLVLLNKALFNFSRKVIQIMNSS